LAITVSGELCCTAVTTPGASSTSAGSAAMAGAAMARLRTERIKGRRQPRAGTNTDTFMVFPEKRQR
jgi:hypothetical protein